MGQSIAALDLGTSKTIALVAQKDLAGKLTILRVETLPSKNAIRRGRIYNSDETSDIISKLIRKLNNTPETMQIGKIYVGIGGQSLHTKSFKTERKIEGGTITRQLLDSMEEEATAHTPEFEENLGVISREYYADGQLAVNPKGTEASVIEARFQLVVGNPCLKRNLEKVFSKKEVSVAGYFISPLATAEAVLTPEEKESGCALVEFGAGVTYFSIYKNKVLKYLITLPLGGLAITKDIRSLNVSENEAETLKIEHGSVLSVLSDDNTASVNIGYNPPRKVELAELNWIIEGRVDEIVKNIEVQIQKSGYSQMLNAGIVITGGGALLHALPQYIRNQIGKEVRLADAKAYINSSEIQLSPSESCAIGLTILGKENCLKEKITKEIVKEENPKQDPQIFTKGEVEVVIKDPKKGSNPFKSGWKKIKTVFEESPEIIFDYDETDNNNNNNNDNKSDNKIN